MGVRWASRQRVDREVSSADELAARNILCAGSCSTSHFIEVLKSNGQGVHHPVPGLHAERVLLQEVTQIVATDQFDRRCTISRSFVPRASREYSSGNQKVVLASISDYVSPQ